MIILSLQPSVLLIPLTPAKYVSIINLIHLVMQNYDLRFMVLIIQDSDGTIWREDVALTLLPSDCIESLKTAYRIPFKPPSPFSYLKVSAEFPIFCLFEVPNFKVPENSTNQFYKKYVYSDLLVHLFTFQLCSPSVPTTIEVQGSEYKELIICLSVLSSESLFGILEESSKLICVCMYRYIHMHAYLHMVKFCSNLSFPIPIGLKLTYKKKWLFSSSMGSNTGLYISSG